MDTHKIPARSRRVAPATSQQDIRLTHAQNRDQDDRFDVFGRPRRHLVPSQPHMVAPQQGPSFLVARNPVSIPDIAYDLDPTAAPAGRAPNPRNAIDAAICGDAPALQTFLVGHSTTDLNARLDDVGSTYALLVARNAYEPEDAIRWLVSKGANPSQADDEGTTPLHAIAERGPRHRYTFEMLLRRDVDPNAITIDGQTPLFIVSRTWIDDPTPAIRALVAKGVDINQPGPFGERPFLSFATHSKNFDAVMRELLTAYADDAAKRLDINASSPIPGVPGLDLGTPLVAVVRYAKNPVPLLEQLLCKGASTVDAIEKLGAYGSYKQSPRTLQQQADLIRTASNVLKPQISHMLPPAVLQAKASLEQPTGLESYDPWKAATDGRADLMKFFIAFNPHRVVRPQHRKDGHAYPLALAVKNNQMHVVRLLVESADDINARLDDNDTRFDINMAPPGHAGETALWHAVESNNQRIARYLLNHGADPTRVNVVKNPFGADDVWNCLDYAVELNRAFLVVELLRWGAQQAAAGGVNPFDARSLHAKLKARGDGWYMTAKRVEHFIQDSALGH